ncbi:MAG: TolC family outer membrane protein [Pseudomonadota bacterium]
MKPTNWIAILLLVALSSQSDAWSQTLTEALRQAHQNNPQLDVQRADTAIAQEQLIEARGQRRPTVTLSGSGGVQSIDSNNPFAAGGENPLASAQLEASLPIYTGGRVASGIRQAEAGINASQAGLAGATQDLMLDVITAYADVLRDRETISIRENSVNLLSEQVRAATDRFEVGVVTRTDVAQAEARLEGANASLAGAQSQLVASEAVYAFLVGSDPGPLADLPEPPVLPANVDLALETGLRDNPTLISLRASERAAEQAVEVARSSLRPTLSIVGTANYQEQFDILAVDGFGPNGTTQSRQDQRDTSVTALAQATVPLYQGGRADSSVRQARLGSAQARLQTQNAERQIRAQIAQSWFATLAAERASFASERQVEAAEIAYEGAQEELAVGVRTTLEVLDQEQQLLEARLSLISAERDYYVALHQLLRAIGALDYRGLVAKP